MDCIGLWWVLLLLINLVASMSSWKLFFSDWRRRSVRLCIRHSGMHYKRRCRWILLTWLTLWYEYDTFILSKNAFFSWIFLACLVRFSFRSCWEKYGRSVASSGAFNGGGAKGPRGHGFPLGIIVRWATFRSNFIVFLLFILSPWFLLQTLLSFLPEGHGLQMREIINQNLDAKHIQAQAEHNAFDFREKANFIVSIMLRLCAPGDISHFTSSPFTFSHSKYYMALICLGGGGSHWFCSARWGDQQAVGDRRYCAVIQVRPRRAPNCSTCPRRGPNRFHVQS